jgi:early secretory antigenic target protein ESAT-6
MSQIIEADPESISSLKDDLVTAASAIDDDLQSLTSELDYLMTQWTGEAASAYLAAQTGWNSSMLSMHAILSEVTALLATISTRYATTESGIVRACGG